MASLISQVLQTFDLSKVNEDVLKDLYQELVVGEGVGVEIEAVKRRFKLPETVNKELSFIEDEAA